VPEKAEGWQRHEHRQGAAESPRAPRAAAHSSSARRPARLASSCGAGSHDAAAAALHRASAFGTRTLPVLVYSEPRPGAGFSKSSAI